MLLHSEIIGKLINKKYELGENDCLSLIKGYVECRYSIQLPFSYKGYDFSNYKELYLKDKEKALIILEEYLDKNFEINFGNFFDVGDILWTKYKFEVETHNICTIGICSGNGLMLSAFPKIGSILVPLSDYKVEKVYKWVGLQEE